MPPLASHPLPDQARSQSPPTSHSARDSPVKVRAPGHTHQHTTTSANHQTNNSDEPVAAAENGAADRGKHKKNLWHRTADPFAGLLTETLPGKLSLRGGRKKSPDASSRGI